MKKIIIGCTLGLSFFVRLTAQTDIEKKYFKEDISDTVDNESVVVVRDYEEYKITSHNTMDFKVNVVMRTQYKLKDHSAVESFNTISKSNGIKKIIITQIKPNGTVKEIYLFEDTAYRDERPSHNIGFNEGGDKMAVEDLEIGDIVDYRYEYTYTTTVGDYMFKELSNGIVSGTNAFLKNYNTFRKLPDLSKFLQEKYPTLSSLYVMKMPDDLKLLQKSVNCNHKFTETKEGGNKLYKCRIGFYKAYKSEYFSYAYADLPVLKFCVVHTRNEKVQNMYPYQFLDESPSADDIAELGRSFYMNKKFISRYLYYVNTKENSKGYKEVSLSQFYGAFIKTFAKDNTDKLDVLNKFHEYICNNDDLNGWQFGKMNFAVLLARFCDKIKQPYKMMACLHRYDGKWDEVIHPSEINWGIYIENDGNDLFISSSGTNSNIFEKQGSLSGTKVILFNTNPKEVLSTGEMTYPDIDYKQNKMEISSEIKFVNPGKNYNYHFVNNYTYTGSQKDNIDDNISYKFYPEKLSTRSSAYGLVSYRVYNEDIYKDTGDFLPEYRRMAASYDKKYEDIASKNFENYLYSEYHFNKITIDSFRIINGEGYSDDDKSDNSFKVEFKAENVIDKTNSDLLLLKLGRLITEQMEISNFRNSERFTNVNFNNQKEIDWDITIELPEGYQPVNLQDFNRKFENSAGIFNATVVQEGRKLKLKIEKTYKTTYLPKEKWNEVIAFLKEAVLFYERKLLLEKK